MARHILPSIRTTPQGLREKNKRYPFLGTLRSSHDRLVAGAWDEIVLDYTVGESGIADGARFKIAFKFYTDWACSRPAMRRPPTTSRRSIRQARSFRGKARRLSRR